MENPWLHLPCEPPFVVEADRKQIEEFNRRADEVHRIHTEVLPEPYLGNPDAAVVLLNLNPGFNVGDVKFHQADQYFNTTSRMNLLHHQLDYPFYLLDPKNAGAPGHRWWTRKLRPLIDICGRMNVARGVFCVEISPYHSKRYRSLPSLLRSQEYSFYLVKKAITRGALIVIMRSRRRWLRLVGELAGYGTYELNSPQNVTLSRKNVPEGFDRIVEEIGRRQW